VPSGGAEELTPSTKKKLGVPALDLNLQGSESGGKLLSAGYEGYISNS